MLVRIDFPILRPFAEEMRNYYLADGELMKKEFWIYEFMTLDVGGEDQGAFVNLSANDESIKAKEAASVASCQAKTTKSRKRQHLSNPPNNRRTALHRSILNRSRGERYNR
jgi:hypothetical protein